MVDMGVRDMKVKESMRSRLHWRKPSVSNPPTSNVMPGACAIPSIEANTFCRLRRDRSWLQNCHRLPHQAVRHVLDRQRRKRNHGPSLLLPQRLIRRLLGVPPCRIAAAFMPHTHVLLRSTSPNSGWSSLNGTGRCHYRGATMIAHEFLTAELAHAEYASSPASAVSQATCQTRSPPKASTNSPSTKSSRTPSHTARSQRDEVTFPQMWLRVHRHLPPAAATMPAGIPIDDLIWLAASVPLRRTSLSQAARARPRSALLLRLKH